MPYFRLITLFPIATLELLAGTVFACSCQRPDEPIVAFERADVVFVGKAIATNIVNEGGQKNFDYRFQVIRNFKSAQKDELVVRTNPIGGGLCGYPFTEGEEYLIYAFGVETLYTNICTRTRKRENAAADLQVLDSL